MTGRGRPLRFLLAIALGWVGGRIAILWPRLDSVPALIDALVPAASAKELFNIVPPRSAAVRVIKTAPFVPAPVFVPVKATLDAAPSIGPSSPANDRSHIAAPRPETPSEPPGLPRPIARSASGSRWSGSAWLLARGGAGISSGVIGGQLGGSQTGVRLAYMLDPRRRIALAARLTSPLGPGLREASIGIEWQPTRLPVRLVAEQRFALNGGHGGPGVAIVGGAGPFALGGGFRLDGYGQAGAVKRDLVEGYVDGAVHVSHPLTTIGAVRVDIGAAAWGAAQRGARRIDLGPSLGAVVPLGGQKVRLSLDWRERVAGRAAPGSGLALTLGADF